MQHISQSHCSFCDQDSSSECSHCSHTIKVNGMLDKTRKNANAQDLDATERVDLQPTDLYQQALERLSADSDDATELVDPHSASFYQAALERQAAKSDDATELVAPRSASFYQAVLERQAAKSDDATELVSAKDANRLYREAMKQESAQASDPADEIKSPPQKAKKASRTAPRKRSRRKFLSIFHLLADILLLSLLLSLAVLEINTHQVQAQEMQKAGQIRQQSLQYRAHLNQLLAQEQEAQLEAKAKGLVSQYNQNVKSWGQAHLYHDSYDGHSYLLDSGYTQLGIGSFINGDLTSAQTPPDFQSLISETQNTLFDFQMMEADYSDHTAYNKVHASDLKMLNYYHLSQKTVLMVSSTEQVMRVYQQGKLVHAFYITTGRPERPSLPGNWSVLDRRSPTIFEAGDPPGSPYWFPNTPINYAILYHYGGFFLHDAPWRGSFGPGTQFPHQDASGNTPYNFDGSHGCVNLTEADAAWVYHHSDWNTTIVIY